MSRMEGCGRFRWMVASRSPLVVISVTFSHQSLRGFLRNLSSPLPCNRSNVHFTSFAVNGFPSCHLTPECSLKVSARLSALHDQLSARSGLIVPMLFWGLC